jgi:hypothetical protein
MQDQLPTKDNTMKFIIAALIAAFPLTATPSQGAGTHDRCKEEDGSGQRVCIWDAGSQGNGVGHSFIAFHGGTDQAKYIYISHEKAYRMTH